MTSKRFASSLFILTIIVYMACATSVSNPNASAQAEGSSMQATAPVQPTAAPSEPAAAAQPSVATPAPQPVQEAAGTIPLPIIPIILEFEYSPKYFIQWIKDNPKYSMIEGIVVQTSPPVYQVVLTEAGDKRRIYYSNSDAQVKILSGDGRLARTTPIEFQTKESLGEQPAHEFAFRDEAGQSIRWKFILASDPSERGGGIAAGRRKGMSFIYRKLGTAAGEGTAIQIGDKVINADPWPQISSPPYFVAFRGAYSTNSLFAGLVAGTEQWQVKSAPTSLKEGESWVLADSQNNKRELRIKSRKGDELIIEEVGQGTLLSLTARATGQGLALRTVSAKSADRFINVTFKPELDLSAASAGEVGFQVDLSGGGKATEGTVAVTKEGNVVNLKWQPRSPNWAKPLAISSSVTIDSNGYKLDVK